jgi:hypothetical protein
MKTLHHPMGFDCRLVKSQYMNKRLALQLIDSKDSSAVCTITVNLPDVPLGENEILVKSYSENEGIDKMLEQSKLALPTGRKIQSGFVKIPVFKLNPEILAEYV